MVTKTTYPMFYFSVGFRRFEAISTEKGHHLKANVLPECIEGKIQEERAPTPCLCWARTNGTVLRFISSF